MFPRARTFLTTSALALAMTASLGMTSAKSADADFLNFISGFYATAAKSGITKKTYNAA